MQLYCKCIQRKRHFWKHLLFIVIDNSRFGTTEYIARMIQAEIGGDPHLIQSEIGGDPHLIQSDLGVFDTLLPPILAIIPLPAVMPVPPAACR